MHPFYGGLDGGSISLQGRLFTLRRRGARYQGGSSCGTGGGPQTYRGRRHFLPKEEDDMKKWIGISLVIAAVAVGGFYGLVYAALRTLVA